MRRATRAWAAAAAACLTLAVVGCADVTIDDSAAPTPAAGTATSPGAPSSTAATTPAPTTTPPPPELPGGGRVVLPGHRLVGFSGAPGTTALGQLTGDLDAAAAAIASQAAPYGTTEPVLPVFELIATVAHDVPGPDGSYSTRAPDDEIGEYLDAARRHGALLLLNIQPGAADFLPEVQAYEKWLKEPDVGVALDPEWAVGPGQTPGEVYGTTSGAELDSVAAYLSGLVAAGDLPQKVMVYHQVAPSVVTDELTQTEYAGVAVIKSVDGIGGEQDKIATWNRLMPAKPPFVASGFKLFYDEDLRGGPLMTPDAVLALVPTPEYVLYE